MRYCSQNGKTAQLVLLNPHPTFRRTLFHSMRNVERLIRILAVLSISVPTTVFVVAAKKAYRADMAETERHLVQTVDVTREHAQKVFETLRLAALHVDDILDNRTDDDIAANAAAIRPHLKQLEGALDQIQDIWVIGADGRPLVSANAFPVPEDVNVSGRDFFKAFKEQRVAPNAAYVGDPMHGMVMGKDVFFLYTVARKWQHGQFSGVIAIAVSPDYFKDYYKDIINSGFTTIALLRSDGTRLARYPVNVQDLPSLPRNLDFVRELRKNPQQGVFEIDSNIEKVNRIAAYKALGKNGLYVALGLDKATVINGWWKTIFSWLLFGVPTTAAMFGMSLMALYLTRKAIKADFELQEEVKRRQASEERNRHLQKMEAVGQLTGGIAHDFNNLLTVILGSLDLLQRRLSKGDTSVGHFLEAATEGAKRAASLTSQLLAFARKQPLDPKPLNPNKLITGMANLIRGTVGGGIELETVLAGGLWDTNIDANQLENAILNLAANARDAMQSGGKITIETGNAYLDDGYAAAEAGVAPGQYVAICVSDTGCGMPREVAERAFDPFFTTKQNGRGTGLGLSQVFGFVKQSEGHIKIYSEEGHGTTVKIYLPRHFGGDAMREQNVQPAIGGLRGSGTILLVEDEDAVRDYSRQALIDLGYTVLDAASGQTALELLRKHPEIDLLLTDIIMPGMGGKELAEKASALCPELKVLYTTGYSRNAIIHNGVLDPGVALINKPFTVDQVGRKLKAVLSKEPAEKYEI